MQNISRKKIFVIIIVLMVAIVAFALFTNKSKQAVNTEPEKGGVPTIVLDDKDSAFYNSVTKTDYLAVKARLTDYVVSQKGDPWTTVKVTDVKRPMSQGETIYSFKASIESLNQQNLEIVFDYEAQPYATFIIKEKGFNVPLYGGQD